MAMSDIQRLRQQSLFSVAPQQSLMGGMEDMGGYAPVSMNYAPTGPMGGRYNPPPIADEAPSSSPFDFLRQPSTGPTFPDQGTMAPRTVQAPGGGTNTPPAGMSLDEYMAAINRGYTPDFTDRDRMRALLDAAPERKAPSLARSIVAAAMSTKAEDPVATAEKVQYAPYYRDVENFKTKAEPFYKAADLENRQNINERTLVSNAVASKTAADRLAENARQADLKNEQAIGRNRIAMMKAQLGQGYKIIARGSTIKILNTATGEVKDTGMSTGWMNEEDKIDAEGEWNVKAAEARGTAAVQTAQAGARAAGRDLVVIDGVTYQRNEDGSFTPAQGLPSGTPTRPGTPPRTGTGTTPRTNTLETRRQIQDRMAELYQTDPLAKKYIRRGAGGGYDWKDRPVVGPATGIWPFNADEVTQDQVNEYDQIRSEVDPNYKPPTRGLAPTTPPGGGGRGGGAQQKTVVKKEYSPSRNQTRITYSDGTTSVVAGKQQ